MSATNRFPHFREESEFIRQGLELVAGVDEAGRGALAGPVVAGAVILGRQRKSGWLKDIRDSKLLPLEAREELYKAITMDALSYGAGVVSHAYIDKNGIVPATRLAMRLAVAELTPGPQALIIDFLRLPEIPLPQKGIIDGDALCVSIACASIIAKVTRDRLMRRLGERFSDYHLAGHKGYGTAEHLERLNVHGPCCIHRRTFAPVFNLRTLL
ncbi:ribonuclease HII [Dehalogenimonas sp. THU2]|uniref:ribonuclease HII n=1 Tax=Dehalogenimonas sp. THU2 TaxID=3151121 RepID=UPI0032182D68